MPTSKFERAIRHYRNKAKRFSAPSKFLEGFSDGPETPTKKADGKLKRPKTPKPAKALFSPIYGSSLSEDSSYRQFKRGTKSTKAAIHRWSKEKNRRATDPGRKICKDHTSTSARAWSRKQARSRAVKKDARDPLQKTLVDARLALDQNVKTTLYEELARVNASLEEQANETSQQTAQDLIDLHRRIGSLYRSLGDDILISTTGKGTEQEKNVETKVSERFEALSAELKSEAKKAKHTTQELQKVNDELIAFRNELSGTDTKSGFAAEARLLDEDFATKRLGVLNQLKRDLKDLYEEAKEGEKAEREYRTKKQSELATFLQQQIEMEKDDAAPATSGKSDEGEFFDSISFG